MITKYDNELSAVEFYKSHKEYLPFIGDRYDEYKIIIVGESHYIGQTAANPKYTLSYFNEHWWDGTADELKSDYSAWFDTRRVISNYINGERSKGHLIFTNIVKEFSETVLNKSIAHIDTESAGIFNCFAFMNFFQMPSLFSGEKYWNSLVKAEKSFPENVNASDTWDKCTEESARVLDAVIDILHPKIVVFSSKSAYSAFNQSEAPHAKDANIKCVPHAGCKWWNAKSEKYDNKSGKEIFRGILIEYKKEFIK